MKRYFAKMITIFTIITLFLPIKQSQAFWGKIARESVEEIIELFSRKFGRELAEEGGETAIRKILPKLVAKYGDEGAEIFKKFGPRSVRMVEKYGDDALKILSRFGDDGMTVISTYGDDAIKLYQKYGDDAIEILHKHPGVGKELIERFGEDGIKIGKNASTKEVRDLLILANRAQREGRASYFAKILSQKGKDAIEFCNKNWKICIGAPTVAYLLSHPSKAGELAESAAKSTGSLLEKILSGTGEVIEKIIQALPKWIWAIFTIPFFIFMYRKFKSQKNISDAEDK